MKIYHNYSIPAVVVDDQGQALPTVAISWMGGTPRTVVDHPDMARE